jgi:hypothetical protein
MCVPTYFPEITPNRYISAESRLEWEYANWLNYCVDMLLYADEDDLVCYDMWMFIIGYGQ